MEEKTVLSRPEADGGVALTEAERQFAALIWQHAPVPSSQLTVLAQQEFGWKKSTTYTMLKRLENKGVFRNAGGTVQTLLTAEELAAAESEQFVHKNFGGSLPRFLAAFTRGRQLSAAEVAQLQALIDAQRGGE